MDIDTTRPLKTRNDIPAEIIARMNQNNSEHDKLVVLITHANGHQFVYAAGQSGKHREDGETSVLDLLYADESVTE